MAGRGGAMARHIPSASRPLDAQHDRPRPPNVAPRHEVSGVPDAGGVATGVRDSLLRQMRPAFFARLVGSLEQSVRGGQEVRGTRDTNAVPTKHWGRMIDVPKSDLTKFGHLGWQEHNEIVILRCPNGHVSELGDHTVGMDGVVSPSAVCPKCGWHETVRLLDY